KGDFKGAIADLTSLSAKVGSGASAAGVRGLLGDATAQNEKPADAAVEYEKAAALASGPNEKAYWRAKAGRAYLLAGKIPEGRKIFEELAAQSDNDAAATEARVRLGEITAGVKP
ncbi:MAG: hypothetical protein ABI625_14055, partial [bacterium]